MLEYLKDLLNDLKSSENEIIPTVIIKNIKQKTFSLETAIEILEKVEKEVNK